jgi:MFS family permease
MIGYGGYYAAAEGTARAYLADFAPTDQRGVVFGLYNGLIAAGALPASLIAGILWQGAGDWGGFGASAPFLFGALLSLIALLLLLLWGTSKRLEETVPAQQGEQ